MTGELSKGCLVADVPTIVGSFDVVMGEICRRRGGRMARQRKSAKADPQVYTMAATLVADNGAGAYAVPPDAHPISRTIEIRADRPLRELHDAIRTAFGFPAECAPEFHFPGSHGRRGPEEHGDELRVWGVGTVGGVGLRAGAMFGFVLSHADEWLFSVHVVAVGAPDPGATYPRLTARVGDDPLTLDDEDYGSPPPRQCEPDE